METTVNELPESRAKIEVEVPAEDVAKATSRAARAMAREMRLPGFRTGKAPPSLVIQRIGFAAVLEEAIREALPEWYEGALLDSRVAAIGDPQIEMTRTPEAEGEPLGFSFEVGVRPPAELGEYKGLEVERDSKDVPDEIVDTEVERIRQGFARLEPVQRAAAEGDSVLIDFEGLLDGKAFQGGAAEDHLLELGSGTLIPGFEEGLLGAEPGAEVDVEVTFPEDYQAEELAGEDAVFKVKVKEVREKILPELDDEFAADATEFDTLEELREDIRGKVGSALDSRAEEDFRVAAIDAAVEVSTVEVPDALAEARAAERWERMERQLAQRGMDPNQFLQMQGKTREQLIEETKPDALKELKREAVVTAIAAAEEIEVSDADLVEALAHSAEHERTTPEKLLERLRANGRAAMVEEDLRAQKAIELVAEAAKPVPKKEQPEEEGADAAAAEGAPASDEGAPASASGEGKDEIWTPEKEREAAGGLWTPGDD